MSSQMPPQIRLPGVDGRESFDDWDLEMRGSDLDGRGGMNLAGTLGGK